ncbi:alpha/beta fold hydrolase [Culicoidibacter larvae]|uniref:Alpha/beta hydrolase n=1 Tax=Culicoidibacter larvae TaxID=2579976 RepID=A0A5R8QBH0_9FIRM|nr:alpha/beta hydrolase [Culicoidibacter larvae]TLG73875.1 alpha/beta hydrolase [Culicoidibacter larvae]
MVVDIKGVPVYYEVFGEGRPVLCIHGYWVDHRLMTGCLEPIFEQTQGYRRIYLDLPGMGKTPAADWLKNADDMLELVIAFIDAVIPGEQLLVAGESFGGYLTLGLIAKLGVLIDGVLMIAPKIVTENRQKLPARTIIWQTKIQELEEQAEALENFMEMAVIAMPEIYAQYKVDVLSGIRVADRAFLTEQFYGGFSHDFEARLQQVEFNRPTCYVTGRQDHVVGYHDAYQLLDNFPRATFAILDGAGHNVQVDNVPLFQTLVKDWLWRLELEMV